MNVALSETGWTPLHAAVLAADHARVEGLVSEGADVLAKTRALLASRWMGGYPTQSGMGQLPWGTLEGTNGHVFDIGATPLHVAASVGDVAMMERLAASGAKSSVVDSVGATPLHLAALGGHVEAIRWLLAKRVKVDRPIMTSKSVIFRDRGMTSLHAALRSGSLAACELLVAAGLRLTDRTDYGRGALFFAAWGGSVEVLEYLVQNGIAANETAAHGNHPLWNAVEGKHHAFAERLLALGADPEGDNQNALRWALIFDDMKMRDILLAAGAKPLPWPDIAEAANGNDVIAVKAMLAAGVDTKHRYVLKAVEAAAWRGRHAVMEALLAGGLSPEGTAGPRRPLHDLLRANIPNLIEVGEDLQPYLRTALCLVEAGARLDIRDPEGNTPLVLLMRWENAEPCIEAMIARGANPYERMTDGRSAMDIARAEWPSRVALLEKTAHPAD